MKMLPLSDRLQMLQGAKGIAPVVPKPQLDTVQDSQQGFGFAEFLSEKVQQLNDAGVTADRRVTMAALGKDDSPHTTMIAVQKAELSFRLLMSVKMKLEQAYQEVMRTQLG